MRPAWARERGELETFTRKVLILVGVLAMLALLWAARAVFLLVFVSAMIAAGIAPAVRSVRARWRYAFRRNLKRGTAVLVVYLPFVLAVIVAMLTVVPRFVSDARALGGQVPALLEQNLLTPLERYFPVGPLREELQGGVELPRSKVFAFMRNAAAAAGSLLAVLFMVAYMLIDGERLRNLLLLLAPPEARGEMRRTLRRIGKRMSAWLSGQLLLATIIGVASFAGFTILGLPHALLLALIAAVGELVPIMGPLVGAVPALAVALFESRTQFWWTLLIVVGLQKIENLFIVPRVMANKVSVSPLAVFVAFLVGASILGVAGAIIAVPVVAIVKVAFEEAFVARRERRQDIERAGTLVRQAD